MPEKDPSEFDSQQEWMSYCMSDGQMESEYPDEDQRTAVCSNMWENREKSKGMNHRKKTITRGVRLARPCNDPQLQVGKAEGDDDGSGWVEGYGSVFGNRDQYDEIVDKGAYIKTINERVAAGKVKLMVRHFAHGGSTTDIVGTVTEAKEDDYGLWIHAEFASTGLAQDTRTLVTEEHVKGLSVGYEPIDWEITTEEDGTEVLHLKELKLYDITLTAVPVNEKAAVTAAKDAASVAERLQASAIAAAESGDRSRLEAVKDQIGKAAEGLRGAADQLDAVREAAEPGDGGKARRVSHWRSNIRRHKLALKELE